MKNAEASRVSDFVDELTEWMPLDEGQAALRDEYVAFVRDSPTGALSRESGPAHITASCFIVTPELSHVVLCFHRKGQFWVQVGGHVEESDASMGDAALREAREESGMVSLARVDARPVDLNRHPLGGAFGACRTHWDVGFAGFAELADVPVESDESEDVRWFAVDELPDQVPPGFAERVRLALAELRAR